MAAIHIVQSPEWGEFKTNYGTKAVRSGNIQYTVHKIPFTSSYFGYCPKVNPFDIDWEQLEMSAKENNCININFDIPNIIKGTSEETSALEILVAKCVKSPKDTFAKYNIVLDIARTDEQLLSNMHKKHRYNLGQAQKHGITVERNNFETFYDLLAQTAERQKYYIHPKIYYQKLWETLNPKGMAHVLTAVHNNQALASWMLFTYQNVLYYPYGGSASQGQNLFPSTLVCWEAIKLGKELGCTSFDMWGAAKDVNDTNDPWHGFTNFKMKFGGKHVEYIRSYDFVLNETMYNMFNFANDLRWKILKTLK